MRSAALLSLPNMMSLSRIVLAPLLVVWRQPEARVGLLLLAGATDLLDGWLARRRRAVTPLGAILDPVADRVFVLTAVGVLVADGLLAPLHALVLLGRDLATTAGFVATRVWRRLRAVALTARPAGKLVTVLQLVTLLAALARPAAVHALVVATAVVTVAAVADYARMLWRVRA